MAIAAIIGAIVSIIGAIISITFGIISMRVQSEKRVGDLYDQMVKFRNEHPEVLRLSRHWTSEHWARVYSQLASTDTQWVTYYCFLELCLSYCNAVLYSKRRLGKSSYENYHKPLVKLLLTEHNLIIEDLLKDGKYISPYIKQFRKDLENEGWNWHEQHEALTNECSGNTKMSSSGLTG